MMKMFVILMMATVSHVHDYIQTHQITYIKYVTFLHSSDSSI